MTIRDVADYQALITSEHALKPKFVASVGVDVSIPAYLQSMEYFVQCMYDVDYAMGVQLDVIGEWVGISRRVPVPITGVFFTWDGTMPAEGWGVGSWKGQYNPASAVTLLGDEDYRSLIKAKIAANNCDGTKTGIYAVFEAFALGSGIVIIDNLDMTMEIQYDGADFTSVQKAIIAGGFIPIKTSGVSVTYTEV